MKKILALTFFFTSISAFADFSGVYHGNFLRNGYDCEFNADLLQRDSKSLTLVKWMTECSAPDADNISTHIDGPMTFHILGPHSLEIVHPEESNLYEARTSLLNENLLMLDYSIYSYLEHTELRYDISVEFKLENGVLNYSILYKQNDQLIFNDRGLGNKIL